MDRTDIRILRELMQAHTVWPARPGPVASYREIARKLRSNPGTIRNRIARMIRSGFLRGVAFYVNPSLLGFRTCSYAVEVAPGLSKADVMKRIVNLEGVVFLEVYRGPLLGLGIAYDSERSLRSTLARVDKLAGCPRGLWTAVVHPPAPSSLTRPEWTLALRLMSGGFQSYGQLAHEMGVPTRTLRRRLAKLGNSGALLSFPRLDFSAVSGTIAAELLVQFGEPSQRAEVESRISALVQDYTVYVGSWESFNIYRLFLPRVSLVTDLSQQVGRMPGVVAARGEFVDDLEEHLGKFKGYAERALASVPEKTARRVVPPLEVRLRVGRSRAASRTTSR